MTARRTPLLAVALLAAGALALWSTPAFCGGAPSGQTSTLRNAPSRSALPVDAVADMSSVVMALQVQQPAWAANLLGVIIPCTILIILYLQSERTKLEDA